MSPWKKFPSPASWAPRAALVETVFGVCVFVKSAGAVATWLPFK